MEATQNQKKNKKERGAERARAMFISTVGEVRFMIDHRDKTQGGRKAGVDAGEGCDFCSMLHFIIAHTATLAEAFI